MTPTPLHLQLAGRPSVRMAAGHAAELPLRDGALLAWLALEGPTPRGRVAELLWPDSGPEAARNSLRQRLFKLRRLCGAEVAVGSTTLALADAVTHDLNGSPSILGNEALAVSAEFDAWLMRRREERQGQARRGVAEELQAAEAAGDYAAALTLAQHWLAREPQLEAVHGHVMRLHYLLGDRSAALQAYARCEQMLVRLHGVRPSAATLALRAMIDRADAGLPVPAGAVPPGVLRPPRLVGRQPEIAAATAAWARGQVVALVAEAGMGKTRLLQHLLPLHSADAGRAQGSGAQAVVHVAARPGDAGVPLATLARLLRAVAEHPPAAAHTALLAPQARRELARVLPEWADGAAPAGVGQRLMLQRAVQELLSQHIGLAALALDDLHFADSASLQLLQAVLEDDSVAGSRRGPAWALAYRPAEAGSALLALHEALTEHARVQPVALAPLDAPALAELVDSLDLPGVSGLALAPGLLQRTGGNPLFVLETLKQAWVEKRLANLAQAQSLPRPLSVSRLIERRLQQLSPAAVALARCAAIAGQDFCSPLAARVLGTTALGLADAWAELEAAQILRDQAFAHDLYFEAALASVPSAVARHLHGEIAAQLEGDSSVAPATLARHWLAARQPERAAPHLERAALAATHALDPASAARLWLQLGDLHEGAGQADAAFQATHQAVLALRSQSSGADLAAAIDRLRALSSTPTQRALALELRAGMFHTRGEPEAAAEAVAQSLLELGEKAPAALRVNLLNIQGVVLRRAGRPAQARAALEEALALARQVSPDTDLPAVLNNLGLLLQEQDDHLGAIALMQEAAERQTDVLTRARVLNNLAISLEERGQAVLAREQRLSAARMAGGSGALVELNLAVSLGAVSRNLGHYREAMVHLERARELCTAHQHNREEDLHRQWVAVWLDLGRMNLAREALEQAERVGHNKMDAALLAIARGRLLWALGQPVLPALVEAEAVLTDAGQVRSLRRLWVVKSQSLPPEDACALLQPLLQGGLQRDNAAAALPLTVRLAQALLAQQRHAEALRHAQRAADWLHAVWPLEMSPVEVQLTLARTALACGEEGIARQAVEAGSQWVLEVAQQHLDPLYSEGWLLRNAVNRDMMALAARLKTAG